MICLILALVLIRGYETRQVNYVMAYTQADAKVDPYMEIPRSFTIEGERTNNYVLQLLCNLYGQKQAASQGMVSAPL